MLVETKSEPRRVFLLRVRFLLVVVRFYAVQDIKQCVTRAGGVRRFYKLDFAARIMDDFLPSSASRGRRLGGLQPPIRSASRMCTMILNA